MCLNLFVFVVPWQNEINITFVEVNSVQLLCKTVCGYHDIDVPPKSDKEEYHLTSRLKQLDVKTCRD